jgi:hypothetical protein
MLLFSQNSVLTWAAKLSSIKASSMVPNSSRRVDPAIMLLIVLNQSEGRTNRDGVAV